MFVYTLKRLAGVIPVLLIVALLVFALVQASPGDPVAMLVSDEATQEDRDRLRAEWGLDRPVYEQFGRFLANAVQGNFGDSFRYREPVLDLILARLPASLELALLSTLLAVLVGVPLGVWSASRPGSWLDNLGSVGGFFGVSMPNFWIGLLLILVFAGYLNWLPSGGRGEWRADVVPLTGFFTVDTLLRGDFAGFWQALRYLALPVIVLGTNMTGIIMQITRAATLEALREDYVMTARAKGLSASVVLWRHALRNALVSIVTIIGLEFGALISGAIIVETVFAWPGIGYLLLQGITFRDYPLITGLVLAYTFLFVLINLCIDVVYHRIDPRIRLG